MLNLQDAITIIGALLGWTASVVAICLWLSTKFRSIEKTIYKEMAKHSADDEYQFRQLGNKIQRLELRIFGFTQHPASTPDSDEGQFSYLNLQREEDPNAP